MKNRDRWIWLWILIIGILYYIWARVTGIWIPCPFRKITGWLCPGCGITTLFMSLARLDFRGAFHANPFLFITGPVLLAEVIYDYVLRMKGRKLPKWNQICLYIYLVMLIAFGIIRNFVRFYG